MDIPGVQASTEHEAKEEANSGAGAAQSNTNSNDGFTPEERRKNELEDDANFKKYLSMLKMKIPLIHIRTKIAADALGYTSKDIDIFAAKEDIAIADSCTF